MLTGLKPVPPLLWAIESIANRNKNFLFKKLTKITAKLHMPSSTQANTHTE